tara:strand:- start:1938 stop:2597 length:660 start_codon:yes stop_codon:yes gene_type:complete
MKKLLKFDEDAYNSNVSLIKKTYDVLKDASQELKRHGVETSPRSLMDGKVYERALKFYEKKYQNSPFFGEINLEKYLQFTDVNISSLKFTEQKIQNQLAIVLKYYPENHEYYSFYEHRREPEIHRMAGKKVELKIKDLFKWVNDDTIEVKLEKKFFELRATNNKQLEKIAAIKQFIVASKKMEIEYEIVKKACNKWIKSLAYDLSDYEVNYMEIVKSVN